MGDFGGFKRTYNELYTRTNQLPEPDPDNPAHAESQRYRQGIIPGPMLNATSVDLPGNVAKTPGDRALADRKSFAPGIAYSESTSITYSHPVEKRQKLISPVRHTTARSLYVELDSQPGSLGLVESELNNYKPGKTVGLVAGAYVELPSAFRATIDQIASQLAD